MIGFSKRSVEDSSFLGFCYTESVSDLFFSPIPTISLRFTLDVIEQVCDLSDRDACGIFSLVELSVVL